MEEQYTGTTVQMEKSPTPHSQTTTQPLEEQYNGKTAIMEQSPTPHSQTTPHKKMAVYLHCISYISATNNHRFSFASVKQTFHNINRAVFPENTQRTALTVFAVPSDNVNIHFSYHCISLLGSYRTFVRFYIILPRGEIVKWFFLEKAVSDFSILSGRKIIQKNQIKPNSLIKLLMIISV